MVVSGRRRRPATSNTVRPVSGIKRADGAGADGPAAADGGVPNGGTFGRPSC